MTVQAGDYGVVRTGGLIGWLIRLLTGLPGRPARSNHATIATSSTEMVEMQPSGACRSPIDAYGTAMHWYRVPMTQAQQAMAAAVALRLVDRRCGYSFVDIAAQFAYRELHVRPKVLARWISNPHRMVCSQSVDWCLGIAGVHLFEGRLPGLVSPNDLEALGEDSGWAVQ